MGDGDSPGGGAALPEDEEMAKKQAAAAAVVEPVVEPVVEQEAVCLGEVPVDDEVAEDNAKARSVVKTAYKQKYAERAVAAGLARKAAQRSTWDWLAQAIAGECLRGRDKLDVDAFLALLEANGVDHSRWTNRSKGWEGRLRMTGRLALQKVVAAASVLRTPDGEELVPPTEWVAKFSN